MFTLTAKHVISRRRKDENNCEMYKHANIKAWAKREKLLFSVVKYANFLCSCRRRVVFVSSSWVLKLPVNDITTRFIMSSISN